MATTKAYSITYTRNDAPNTWIAGFTTDKSLWETILQWNQQGQFSRFKASAEEEDHGEYNEGVREKMRCDGGIRRIGHGDISSGCKYMFCMVKFLEVWCC